MKTAWKIVAILLICAATTCALIGLRTTQKTETQPNITHIIKETGNTLIIMENRYPHESVNLLTGARQILGDTEWQWRWSLRELTSSRFVLQGQPIEFIMQREIWEPAGEQNEQDEQGTLILKEVETAQLRYHPENQTLKIIG